jgi:hypothetical protein
MTERVKGSIRDNPWGAIAVALLVIIGGALGWQINRLVTIQERQQNIIDNCRSNIESMARVIHNDPDTRQDDREEMRMIYFPTRGATRPASNGTK